jgi:hypothetical protein
MGGWVGLHKLITDLDMRNGYKGGVRVGFIYISLLTRHRHGAPVRAQRGTPAPVLPRARARTTRHARTCNGATVE